MANYTTVPKKTYLCQKCDAQYGTCEHNHDFLPKEESGKILSAAEFQVLFENGDIE